MIRYILYSQPICPYPCRSGTTQLKVPNGDRGGLGQHPAKTISLHFVKCQGVTSPSTFFWTIVICFTLAMDKTLPLPLSYCYAIWITLGRLSANWMTSLWMHMNLSTCGVTKTIAPHQLTSYPSNRLA